MIKRSFILLIILLATGCGSKKKIITKKSDDRNNEVVKTNSEVEVKEEKNSTAPTVNSTSDYIAYYKDLAITEMELYKIPASITLAQGILESGSGRGRLAVEANNHFGIKCHGWEGQKIYHDDDKSQECFRKYVDAKQSFRDHSEFLSTRKRYSKLFNLKITNYKGWAKELRKAGYATDKKYPQKLISLIERYDLNKFDYNQKNINETKEHEVVKGDTLYSIAKRYNLTVQQLKQLNKLETNAISIGQILRISDL